MMQKECGIQCLLCSVSLSPPELSNDSLGLYISAGIYGEYVCYHY